MPSFFTPPGFAGSAELTVATGLSVQRQGLWQFSQPGYNDGVTFGVSLTHPAPQASGELWVRAHAWPIAVIGNELTPWTQDSQEIYPASQCRIMVTGRWMVVLQSNSNSFNGVGVEYSGSITTDQGSTGFWGTYQGPLTSYLIQGSGVTGGALDTFTDHVFEARCEQATTTVNSNRQYQSNTICRPAWIYSYSKSWQVS
jgi:hypothetical protein